MTCRLHLRHPLAGVAVYGSQPHIDSSTGENKDLEDEIDSFQKYTLNLGKKNSYELGQIGNMDETPMTSDVKFNLF